MKDVIEQVDDWVARGDQVALATVVGTKRSAPRPPGAKMAINSRGEVYGAVSGGCVEGAVVQVAEGVLAVEMGATAIAGVLGIVGACFEVLLNPSVTGRSGGLGGNVGAAIAQVSGEVDRIFSYDALGRDQSLETARAEATGRAIAAGAVAASVHVVDVEELPLQYLPGGSVRIRVKVVGDLNLGLTAV